MKVLVTGGAGFIGRRLVAALLEQETMPDAHGREQTLDAIRVSDVAEPLNPFPGDERIETIYGDLSENGAAARLVSDDVELVFHLAAVVSGEAETNFDLGLRINLDGTRRVLEACRRAGQCPRVVFSSSVAAYGGAMPEVIRDDTPANPQTSYGVQKVMSEYLVGDFSRKRFIDGRSLRLPTIVVRPGKPNAAASSFASSIIREPLQGDEFPCPVPDGTGIWVLSPRQVVEAFLHAARLPQREWEARRTLALPGITVTIAEVLNALKGIGGRAVVERIRFDTDPFIEKIVQGWPVRFAPERALAMGFAADEGIDAIIQAFVDDELGGRVA